MTESPKRRFLSWDAPGRFGLILGFIALAAAIPRLLLGASQFIEYDGYWHVFIAQQDNWARFWNDIYTNAHPPLYFLLLKVALRFGRSPLIYRSISLLTGIASVLLAGWIARKITGSRVRAWQSALAYGLALPAIIVSCEVRSYMLSVFFVLVSFWYLLDIPDAGNTRSEADLLQIGARTGFAAGAILACLSHYFAFFYSGAAMLLLAGRFILRRFNGATGNWKTETAAEAATILPVAATIFTLYQVHAGALAQIQGHLIPYYFDPRGHETRVIFLLRNWRNFVNLFSPFQLSSPAAAGVLTLAVIGGVLAARLSRRVLWTVLITAIMLAAIALAALAGKYPFGGDLRQQYLLFPFLILCGAIFVELVARKLSRFVPVPGRQLLNTLAIVAIVAISAVRYEQYPKVQGTLLADQMAAFDRLEDNPAAVYVDQFNLITFFTHHDTWRWASIDLRQPVPGVEAYRLTRGARQMLVFRDKTEWNIDPDDASAYVRLRESLRGAGIPEVSIFDVRQSPPKPPFSDLRQVRLGIVAMANGSSVCVQRLAVNRVAWYATFRRSNCAPIKGQIPQMSGVFDDAADDIQYTGQWAHASFQPAAGGALSYSNDPGSAARLSFYGTAIAYVYTRAFNRGIAEIKLDGASRGEIDLYSPKVVWQTRTVFDHLAPGPHQFELVVTGRKQAAASDRFVDLDALIVH